MFFVVCMIILAALSFLAVLGSKDERTRERALCICCLSLVCGLVAFVVLTLA